MTLLRGQRGGAWREIQIVDSRLANKSPLFWFLRVRRFIYLEFVGRVSRRHFDLKIGIVLILRSRQTMKRDLYHWILRKILKKKPLINFFRQLSLRNRLKFRRVFIDFFTNSLREVISNRQLGLTFRLHLLWLFENGSFF